MKTLRRFFSLAAPFWGARAQWREWLLLLAVVACSLAIIRINVWINEWNKVFYDALAEFNGAAMPELVVRYLAYLALVVVCVVLGSWLRKILVFRWREHLTQHMQAQWLRGQRHYRLQLADEPDNPDQRIAEDIYLLADKTVDLVRSFSLNVAKLGAFVSILWHLSSVLRFDVAGRSIAVHGYLVWVALVFSGLSTLLTHWIGRKLQDLNVQRQHREADYRAALLRVRDHAEQIAFYRGEAAETWRLNERFAHIRANWRALIARELKLECFTATHLRLSVFIPILATLPLYLARVMSFGGMMQARNAFGNVLDGFGWFMDYYKRLIEWAAVVQRLAQFQTALEQTSESTPAHEASSRAAGSPRAMPAHAAPAAELRIAGLMLHTAEGQVLLRNLHLHAVAPQWLLLQGPSGIGKTTLLRALAGLWPYYQGQMDVRADRCMFLPQRPYLPQGSLRAVVSYPGVAQQGGHKQSCDADAIERALHQVGLGQWCGQLDQEQEWRRILSGGEQQRLSLARVLLHQPQALFLDEASSQLDEDAAQALMRMLRQCLPHMLCVGTSHQPGVQALFERKVDLAQFCPPLAN